MPQWTLRISAFLALLCAAIFCVTSFHWPLVSDASLMHYVSFLIDRGHVPYKEIADVNLPGTYLVERLVIHTLGDTSLAWRLFDIALGIAATLAMIDIATPLTGLLAGSTFFLLHGRDGMGELGQRDLVMTVLLLASTAFFLRALRHRPALYSALASLAAGMAITIKPTAILFWIAMLTFTLWQTRQQRLRTAALSLAGLLLPPAITALTLLRSGALGDFLHSTIGLIALHNQLLRVPASYYLLHPLPSTLLPLFVLWLALLLFLKKRFTPTETLLFLGFLCGLASFFLQRKALPYHRYPADAFLLLLMILTFSRALQHQARATKAIAATGLIFTAVVLAPQCLLKTLHFRASPTDFSGLLQSDLASLGGHALDKNIQCIDFTAGCVTTLYRMRLEQSTGYLYDCYLFQPADADTPAADTVRRYREAFWTALTARTPQVLVLSDQDCGRPHSFAKVDRWPALADLIASQYRLEKQVTPPETIRWASTLAQPYSYRVYIRK